MLAITYNGHLSQNDTPETASVASASSITSFRNSNLTDEDVCREFIEHTCGCQKINGRPSSSQFSMEYYIEQHAQASLLTRNELNLVMLGCIMSTTRGDKEVVHRRHQPVKMQRPRAHYMHNGCVVCKVTFGFIFGVGMKHKIQAIQTHYLEEGLTPRVHKNSRSKPHNTFSFNIKAITELY